MCVQAIAQPACRGFGIPLSKVVLELCTMSHSVQSAPSPSSCPQMRIGSGARGVFVYMVSDASFLFNLGILVSLVLSRACAHVHACLFRVSHVSSCLLRSCVRSHPCRFEHKRCACIRHLLGRWDSATGASRFPVIRVPVRWVPRRGPIVPQHLGYQP